MKNTSRQKSFGAKSEPGRLAHLRGLALPAYLHETLAQQLTNTPSDKIKWLIEFGAVYVNHRRETNPERTVSDKDQLRVHLDPKRFDVNLEEIKERILFQNEHFIIFDKPTGLPMHPTLDNLRENLVGVFNEPLFVTHRLDVPTSGVVLVAKTKEYQAVFNQVIMDRQVQKSYQALTIKKLETQKLIHFMKVSERAPKELVKDLPAASEEKFDECVLKILACEPVDFKKGMIEAPGFEIRIELITGRTHQIRAQLSFEGAPIVGDEMYGGMPWSQFGLNAEKLSFICPITQEKFEFQKTKTWK